MAYWVDVDYDLDWCRFQSSSRMCVMNHNWSATKQRLHPRSVAEISRHSVLLGDRILQCGTSSGSRHGPQVYRSVSVSRHFLLQAPQCPCSVRKRFSRAHSCRGRSKLGCRIAGAQKGESWPTESTSSYASVDFWCPLVANPATAASWMSVVAMVG